MRMTLSGCAWCFVAFLLDSNARTAMAETPAVHEAGRYEVIELARGLAHPWSVVFLPSGEMLVSERNGGLRLWRDRAQPPVVVGGVPQAYAEVDGGLLGLAVHPEFERTRLIYLCLSQGDEAANASAVIRGRLHDRALVEVETVFRAQPLKAKASHFGCRLLFAPDGSLFVTLGDGYDYRDEAQTLDDHFGKVVRLRDDGSIPPDNPFLGVENALADIYTYGHRNVQGIALRPGTNEIFIHEHGPRGGDEVNVLVPGANYGWPTTTWGIDYSGAIISELTVAPGIEPPLLYWDPSIAPSGMAFYDGEAFAGWRGDLFVGALAGKHLRRVDLDADGRVAGETQLLDERGERIRDVAVGPEGFLYVLTDSADGAVLQLRPPPRTLAAPP